MKMKIYCILIAISIAGLTHATKYSNVKYNLETPFTGLFTSERFDGSGIMIKIEGQFPGSAHIVYMRSEDGLRDTVFYNSGASRIEEHVYSPEGRLIESNELIPDPSNITEFVLIRAYGLTYLYDEEGRITAIVNDSGGSTIYDYSQNTITYTNNDGSLSRMIQVVYNDSGYICQTTTYENVNLSGKDTTFLKHDTIEYVFDSENRLIRRSGTVFEYNDNGYCSYGNSNKEEYIFDNEFGPKMRKSYQLIDSEWEIYETRNYSYYYNNTASDITGNHATSSNRVYGISGAVSVELEQSTQVDIYSISGQLVKREYLGVGRTCIPLAPGFYLVQVGGKAFKIIIK